MSFFGVLFPLGFWLVYICIAIEIFMEYDLYFKLRKKPTCLGESSLKSFSRLYYFVFLISIVVHLFIMTYLSFNFYGDDLITSGVYILASLGGVMFVLILNIMFGPSAKVSSKDRIKKGKTEIPGEQTEIIDFKNVSR